MPRRAQHKPVKFSETLYLSIAALIILVVCAFALPVEFSGYRSADRLAPIWYLITESGGILGSAIATSGLLVYLLLHFRASGKNLKSLAVLSVLIVAVELLTLGFTQLYTKDLLKEPRPSQLYLIEKGVIENGGREYFAMPMEEKQIYLKQRSGLKTEELKDVYPPVLTLWTEDLTYSFPSGHAQSSFFLGVMFSYAMSVALPRRKAYLAGIPLAWAVLVSLSRVIIGMHFPADVSAGALTGMICAMVVIRLPVTQKALSGV